MTTYYADVVWANSDGVPEEFPTREEAINYCKGWLDAETVAAAFVVYAAVFTEQPYDNHMAQPIWEAKP